MLRIVSSLTSRRVQSLGVIPRMFAAAAKPPTSPAGAAPAKKEVAKKTNDLSSILAIEIKEEDKIEEADNQDYQEVSKEILTHFRVEEVEERAVVRLVSEKGGERVTVEFNVYHENDSENQDVPEEEEHEHEEGENAAEGGEEGDESRSFGLDFITKVTKHGESLTFNCTAYGDQLVINQVSLNREGMSDKELEQAYVGPLVDTLSEALLEGFMKYLNKRNVNVDLCFFILHKAREVENGEYKRWLKRLQSFVNK